MKLLFMKIKTLLFFTLVILIFSACSNEPFDPATTDIRTEISKEWNVTENDGSGDFTFLSLITKDASDETKVSITNFHNLASVKATVFSDRTISVSDQTLAGSATELKNCVGTISDTYQTINWTYTIVDQDGEFSVTAVYTSGNISKKKKIFSKL